jgi:nitrogen fixation protein NifB
MNFEEERGTMVLAKEKISKIHPCLGACGGQYGRLHLPVCSQCNIQCRFCRRAFNAAENRPGVAQGLLGPENAVEKVARALELCPEITVVGIAGPGDTLATDEAVETFRAVRRYYPHLISCMSTNGLMLGEYADTLRDTGVSTITVTVNGVDPAVVFNVVSRVTYRGYTYRGMEGPEILIRNQLEGIRRASEFAVVKVNTVLIPGVNDNHIEEIARAVRDAGAELYNIIPLIPQHEFKDHPAPDCDTLMWAREQAEKYLPVFRHCQHCRADACGIPGFNEFAEELYGGETETFSHG